MEEKFLIPLSSGHRKNVQVSGGETVDESVTILHKNSGNPQSFEGQIINQ
ncbi:hypothetical protein [Aquiflexum sp.]